MDVAYDLARHIASIGYDDLPELTRRQTTRFILDTLTVAAAGTRAFGMDAVVEALSEQGGAPEATVIGQPRMLPAASAALIHGGMIQAWGLDDVHDEAFLHINCVVLPAAMAIGERQRSSGRDVLTAIALGVDLACRLSRAMTGGRGWYRGATCGVFGAAAAAAKLLGLDLAGIFRSLGVALSQAAGTSQAANDGGVTMSVQSGFAAQAGVQAALLAAKGVTGAREIFQGSYGLFPLYTKNDADVPALLAGLGETYLGDTLSFKFYPCCRGTHGAIEATLALCDEQRLAARDVESISVSIPPVLADLVSKHVELDERVVINAQFSVPYAVACALVRGSVKPEHFSPAAIGDPEVRKIAHCIKVEIKDAEELDDPRSVVPVDLEVHCTDGRILRSTTKTLKGTPSMPISESELLNKARECLAFAGPPHSTNAEHIIELALAVDELPEINQLMTLLRG